MSFFSVRCKLHISRFEISNNSDGNRGFNLANIYILTKNLSYVEHLNRIKVNTTNALCKIIELWKYWFSLKDSTEMIVDLYLNF